VELAEALHILANIHTRDDDQVGFVVLAGAQWRPLESQWTQAQYIEAWEVVRRYTFMQTKPTDK
jgi:hypothetical protein